MKYVLIGLLLIAVVIVATIIIRKRKSNGAPKQYQLGESLPGQIHLSPLTQKFEKCPKRLSQYDKVMIRDIWYEVTGLVLYQEDGDEWFEYRLKDEDSDTRAWVAFEPKGNEDWKVSLWHDAPVDAAFPFYPQHEQIHYRNTTYRYDDDGTASYTVEGKTDFDDTTGTVEYWDYKAKDGKLLSYERLDGDKWEVSVGEKLDMSEVMDFPVRHKYS